jgi:hypothetical protein
VPIRAVVSLVIAIAVLTAGALGLNRGLVLCVDVEGHIALESSHVRHAHDHSEGADHEPHNLAGGSDHDELHAAMGSCSDAGVGKGESRSGSSVVSRGVDTAPLPAPIASARLSGSSAAQARIAAGDSWGSTAHPELAILRAVVLLV